MSRLGPPARILPSMPWKMTRSWPYVLPLKTDCTSELTEALTPSRRSPAGDGALSSGQGPDPALCPHCSSSGPASSRPPPPLAESF